MTDDRPWLVFKSPKRGIRVKKRDVLAIGQGRADEEKVGELPAALSSHDAVMLARQKFGKQPTKAEKLPWFGYWAPRHGARAHRGQIPFGDLRQGEFVVGQFAADMEEDDVLGMIKAKFPKPTKTLMFKPRQRR